MKSVLYSIQPWHVANILSGDKDLEIRLRIPNLMPPYKAYIYCTMGGAKKPADYLYISSDGKPVFGSPENKAHCNGKVIAEFVCDYTKDFLWVENEYPYKGGEYAISDDELEQTCLTYQQLCDYGDQRDLHGIHISELKVYDEPRELREFVVEGDCDCMNCRKCIWADPGNGYNVEDDCNLPYEYMGKGISLKPLFRPPQSWCYVEELPL